MGKRRVKVPGTLRRRELDTDAMARSLVARGLASPRILEPRNAPPTPWVPAERGRRQAGR